MSEVAAIGEPFRVGGFALAGVHVYPAESPDQARAAWLALPTGIDVVILSPAAAGALGGERTAPHARLSVVMPG